MSINSSICQYCKTSNSPTPGNPAIDTDLHLVLAGVLLR